MVCGGGDSKHYLPKVASPSSWNRNNPLDQTPKLEFFVSHAVPFVYKHFLQYGAIRL